MIQIKMKKHKIKKVINLYKLKNKSRNKFENINRILYDNN